MSGDKLSGYRDERIPDEDIEAVRALLYARDNLGLSDDIMEMYTIGVEARERLKSDRVLMWLVKDATDKILGYFHQWLHDAATPEELAEIRRKALAHKLMIDNLESLRLAANQIEKQLERE